MHSKAVSSRVTTWFILCSVIFLLHFGRDFLLPIAVATFIAFVLAPFVDRLTRWHVPRVVATGLTMAALGGLFTTIGWILANQISDFGRQLPTYSVNIRAKIATVKEAIGGLLEQATSAVRDLNGETSLSSATDRVAASAAPDNGWWSVAQNALGSMADVSTWFAVVFLLAFVILLRWEDLRDRLLALAGEGDLQITTRASQEAARRVSIYLRRQMLVNVAHGGAMGLILWSNGVPNPLVWAILGAFLRFVPYVGPVAATAAPILVSLASSMGWSQTWTSLIALVSLEIVTNNVIEPFLYGTGTGISPFALLVSATFWTWIWGPIGLALSTPLTLCLIVMGKYVTTFRFIDVLLSDTPAMPAHLRLYQRLLAGDEDGAWDIVRRAVKTSSLVAASDHVLLAALGTTGRALAHGRIEYESRDAVGKLAHAIVDELAASLPRTTLTDSSRGPPVRCLPARDALDALGARLLAMELGQRGVDALATVGQLLAETTEDVRTEKLRVVCVSSVVPTHFLQVRTVCKRLLAASERVEIIVGLWGEELANQELTERLPDSPRVHAVSSLADAASMIQEIVSRQDASSASVVVSA